MSDKIYLDNSVTDNWTVRATMPIKKGELVFSELGFGVSLHDPLGYQKLRRLFQVDYELHAITHPRPTRAEDYWSPASHQVQQVDRQVLARIDEKIFANCYRDERHLNCNVMKCCPWLQKLNHSLDAPNV